jgi:hypothetical protein
MGIFGKKTVRSENTTALTSKEAFKNSRVVPVETSAGPAFLRVISGKERDAWMRLYRAEQEKATESPCEAIYCPLLVRTICDESGNRLFADDDVALLAESPAKVLHELFERSLDINRLSADAVEDEKKDSGQTQSLSSGLPSPPTSE